MADRVQVAEDVDPIDLCHIVDPDSTVALCGHNVISRPKHPNVRLGDRCATCQLLKCASCFRFHLNSIGAR